jgi:L-methionine (R)-S-oxide reductase
MTHVKIEPNKNLQSALELLALRLKVDVCNLYRYSSKDSVLTLIGTVGLAINALGYQMKASTGLTGRVARTKRALPLKNPQEHPDYHHIEDSGEEKYKSYLGQPITDFANGEVIGVLVIQTVEAHTYNLAEIQEASQAGRELKSYLK